VTRCLQQISHNKKEAFPATATDVLQNIFLDDLTSGAQSQDEAIELQKWLTGLSEKGGFH
jgi:hypothetical protein